MAITQGQTRMFNDLYRRGCSLVRPFILLDGRRRFPWPAWLVRRRLRKGVTLFRRALEINPDSWQSRFWIAKALQRLGDHQAALSSFSEAQRIDAANSDITKEAASEALELGDAQHAVELLRPAAQEHPEDAALQHNLAVALVLCGNPQEANEVLVRSGALRTDPLAVRLLRLIQPILRGERACPATLDDLRRSL